MTILLVICGLPGTGKTTLAKKIAAKVKGVLLRTDVIRKELGDLKYSEKEKQQVYDEMFFRAESLLKEGYNVVIDATFTREKNLKIARKIAENLKADFKIIEVVCPEKIVRERMEKRGNDESEAEFKHYLEHKKLLKPIREKHITIDTSQNIEQQLRKSFTANNKG